MDISKLFNDLDIFAEGYISTRSFISERAALYSALLAAKKCILNDRQYCILKGENYDAKNIARNLIVKYNDMAVKPEANGKFKRTKTGLGATVARPGYPAGFAREMYRINGDKYVVPETK